MKYKATIQFDITDIKPGTDVEEKLKAILKQGITMCDCYESWCKEDPMYINQFLVKVEKV